MSQRDSLDDLLHRAFEADRARTPGVDVASRVTQRLRSRRRLRLGVLAGAAIAGAGVLTLSSQPALDTLLEAMRSLPTSGWDHALMPGLLAVIAVAWLMLMDEELS